MHRIHFSQYSRFAALIPIACAVSVADESIKDRLERDFEPQLADFMRENSIPGVSVAAVADGQVAYLKGFDVVNVDTKALVTPRSLFHLASVTKTFVATSVMQLVDAGKVELDAPIIRIAPLMSSRASSSVSRSVKHPRSPGQIAKNLPSSRSITTVNSLVFIVAAPKFRLHIACPCIRAIHAQPAPTQYAA
jgi:hypothetical protein